MDPVLDSLRAALNGRYDVEQEIGRGGMAVVYRARDIKHDRTVAIKVLDAGLGPTATERFLREIRTVAPLHHPHIVPLYDSGSAGDLIFYVMPCIEGETLRQRLERAGAFTVEESIRVAGELADALDFAHTHGVIHRDIKPENVFLSGGHALIGDFGIARATDVSGLKKMTLTDVGVAVGTPAYMSPEQASADSQIDGRSDQYSLACVIYEMLAGHPPFAGSTSRAIMARHTSDAVPPLTTVRAVATAMNDVVIRALAKAPADRWPSVSDFASALTRSVAPAVGRPRMPRLALAGLAVAALAAALGIIAARRVLQRTKGVPSLPIVAVLPFATSDSSHGALADGLTDGVATALVRVPGIGVLYGGRVASFRERTLDAMAVGKELGATAVLSANLRSSGETFRVIANLIDVASGRTIWLKQFDGEFARNGRVQDVFAMQDEITLQIVNALLPQLGAAAPGSPRSPRSQDSVAYQLYLKAEALPATVPRGKVRRDSVIALLHAAAQRDTTFVDAWIAYADAYIFEGLLGEARPADVNIAVGEALDHVFRTDPENADAFHIRGLLKANYTWDIGGAVSDQRRAARLAPGSVEIAADYSGVLALIGAHDSAIAQARRAVAIDPRNAFAWSQLGNRFAFAGLTDSAIAAAERAVTLDKTWWASYWLLMNGYRVAGRHAEADRAARDLLQYSGEEPAAISLAATYYRASGNSADAADMLRRIGDMAKRQYVALSTVGVVRLAIGDRAGALDALEESVRNHEFAVQNDFMGYDELRGDPRYEAVRRAILPGVPRIPAPWR